MAKRFRKKAKAKTSKARRPAARARRAAKPPKKPAGGVAPNMQPVNAYLAVRDVRGALEFYERAFGFKRRFAMPGPEGKLMHAEVSHGESVIMMGPESPQEAAARDGAARVTLYVYVPDVDRIAARAKAAGGTLAEEPKDQFWGDRTAIVIDPDGHRWTIATFKKLIPPDQMKPPTA